MHTKLGRETTQAVRGLLYDLFIQQHKDVIILQGGTIEGIELVLGMPWGFLESGCRFLTHTEALLADCEIERSGLRTFDMTVELVGPTYWDDV